MSTNTHPVDAWIDAIPEGRNDRCPCGCGMKWKKVCDTPDEHEKRFIEARIKETSVFSADQGL